MLFLLYGVKDFIKKCGNNKYIYYLCGWYRNKNMDMRIRESIRIKDVGPIKELTIEDIKPFTVFIGSSASGKSTIMKIVVLMRYIYKMVNIRSYLKNSNINKSPFRIRFDSLLNDGLEKMVSASSEIEYTVRTADGNEYKISYSGKKLYANILVPNKDLTFFKESFIAETRSMIPTWASKVSSNKGAKLGFYFHETFKDFNDASEYSKVLDLDFMSMRMKIMSTKNGKRYVMEDVGENATASFELRHASSGIQTAVPLLLILHYFSNDFSFKDAFQRSVLTYLFEQDRLSDYKPGIERNEIDNYVHIHIEEPELSLDPNSQRTLLDMMLRQAFHDKADDRTLGVMIATHSPYIVNQLNVFLRASYSEEARGKFTFITEDEVAVYSVGGGTIHSLMATDNNSGETVINTIDLSDPMAEIYNDYVNIK